MRKLTRLLCFICCIAHFLAKVLGNVNVNSMVCDFNDEIFSNGACYLRPCGRVKCLTTTSIIRIPVDNLWLHMRLIREVNATTENILLNHRQDLCNLTNVSKGNYFATGIMGLISKYMKNIRCPLKRGNLTTTIPVILYFAEAFYTTGNYAFKFSAFTSATPAAALTTSFTIS